MKTCKFHIYVNEATIRTYVELQRSLPSSGLLREATRLSIVTCI
jgi:hypothetical protein